MEELEKKAEEYGLQQALWCTSESGDLRDAYIDGAEFGYNKAILKLRNCMNCKHRDTKGHSSCKDKGIVLCSHWEMKE